MSVIIGTYALVSLQEAKSYLIEDPLADLGTKEDLIKRLINGVSASSETYMNRKIKARSYTEDYDGMGTDTLYLNQYPINSISTVCIDEDRAFPSSKNINTSDIIIYSDEGIIKRTGSTLYVVIDEETGKIIRHFAFDRGKKNIRVTYNAGYTSVPDDIKHVVLEEISWHYDSITKKKLGITGVSAMGEHTSVFTGDLLPTTKMVLSSYMRPIV